MTRVYIWSSKHEIDKSVLTEYKGKVVHKVDVKINNLSNKTSSKFHKSVPQQVNPLDTLNDNHHYQMASKLMATLHLFVKDFMHLL